MKYKYIAPKIRILSLQLETMLALSTGRIPVDDTPKPPETNKYERTWGNQLWEDEE